MKQSIKAKAAARKAAAEKAAAKKAAAKKAAAEKAAAKKAAAKAKAAAKKAAARKVAQATERVKGVIAAIRRHGYPTPALERRMQQAVGNLVEARGGRNIPAALEKSIQSVLKLQPKTKTKTKPGIVSRLGSLFGSPRPSRQRPVRGEPEGVKPEDLKLKWESTTDSRYMDGVNGSYQVGLRSPIPAGALMADPGLREALREIAGEASSRWNSGAVMAVTLCVESSYQNYQTDGAAGRINAGLTHFPVGQFDRQWSDYLARRWARLSGSVYHPEDLVTKVEVLIRV